MRKVRGSNEKSYGRVAKKVRHCPYKADRCGFDSHLFYKNARVAQPGRARSTYRLCDESEVRILPCVPKMELAELNRHFRHYDSVYRFVNDESHWMKEILGDAFINYEINLREMLKLIQIRMKSIVEDTTYER